MTRTPRTAPRPVATTLRGWRRPVGWFVLGTVAVLVAFLYVAARAVEGARRYRDSEARPPYRMAGEHAGNVEGDSDAPDADPNGEEALGS